MMGKLRGQLSVKGQQKALGKLKPGKEQPNASKNHALALQPKKGTILVLGFAIVPIRVDPLPRQHHGDVKEAPVNIWRQGHAPQTTEGTSKAVDRL